MKSCRECDYFEGYNFDDGTPQCACDGGFESCPYNDHSNVRQTGMKIEIDAGFMHDYIAHTLRNTLDNCAVSFVELELKKLVTTELKDMVLMEMRQQISAMVARELAEFMERDITIGGGWSSPERTISRTAYLSSLVEAELASSFKKDQFKKYVERATQDAINRYDKSLRDEVNAGIKQYFNDATRQVLTENIVSMLMCNDTYKKLSDSMQTFLPIDQGGNE